MVFFFYQWCLKIQKNIKPIKEIERIKSPEVTQIQVLKKTNDGNGSKSLSILLEYFKNFPLFAFHPFHVQIWAHLFHLINTNSKYTVTQFSYLNYLYTHFANRYYLSGPFRSVSYPSQWHHLNNLKYSLIMAKRLFGLLDPINFPNVRTTIVH